MGKKNCKKKMKREVSSKPAPRGSIFSSSLLWIIFGLTYPAGRPNKKMVLPTKI